MKAWPHTTQQDRYNSLKKLRDGELTFEEWKSTLNMDRGRNAIVSEVLKQCLKDGLRLKGVRLLKNPTDDEFLNWYKEIKIEALAALRVCGEISDV